ncbi:MAG: carboxymuconolactone decarboxylase family protein [Betaproteobacteria bacterium]|nr:carboxymuconolactone decarboxylase family protein [Pseudomonadota bacterium]NBO11290.1 carboxymuconolactone decarboxylase family protein [Betaproteobacteria bacterium]NBO44245.1 carboxymuconolactone decarboxylase family protein [Betaproteobacteria bacterium]NBP09539.1 carboxymuconolactone decarboxylase family protein [Betaproteobacteria bacterium]NBP60866.1 carboxymuconolactone decarboxylase family protein [Betaproteobacteria bacterium]
MPYIPYLPEDLAEPAAVVDAIRKRRGGDLLHLDRMLLHSPPFAQGWNLFLGAVRNDLSLSPKLRELAMCAVAVLNRADYEFVQHAPLYLQAGATQDQVQALRDPIAAIDDASHFDELERCALAVIVAMTRDVVVGEALMQALRAHLSDREVIELCGVTAAYNMVSRFLVATGIHPDDIAKPA